MTDARTVGADRNAMTTYAAATRTALFDEDVNNLHDWMVDRHRTDDDAAIYIYKDLLQRGEVKMKDLGQMSPEMELVADGFDEIGWVDTIIGSNW